MRASAGEFIMGFDFSVSSILVVHAVKNINPRKIGTICMFFMHLTLLFFFKYLANSSKCDRFITVLLVFF